MKTILITGSTDGIGKLTALKLAEQGHHVLFHGRNRQKLQATIEEAKVVSKNDHITGFVSDLSDFDSIHKMAEEIFSQCTKIDVLINNAGVFLSSKQQNQDQIDMRFAVNYFAPYILTNEMKPLLKKGASPRLINLSSAAQASVAFDVLKGTTSVAAQSSYAQSKLALTMWSFDFAKANPEITTIAVNPGSLLNTKMVQEAYGKHWSPAQKGVDVLCDLALSSKFDQSSGKYFDNDNGMFNQAHQDAYNQQKINQLISETEKMIAS